MSKEKQKGKSVVEILDFEKWKIVFTGKQVHVDNVVFRMFGNWTVGFLLCMALLTFLFQTNVLGDDKRPIKCLGPKEAAKDAEKKILKAVETYCFFVSTTYTRPSSDFWLGRKATHPGKPIKYNAYYQWVPFVLFLQAWLFRLPYLLWQGLEGGRMNNFCSKILPKKKKKDDKEKDGSKKKDKEKHDTPEILNLNPEVQLQELARAVKAYSTAGLNKFYSLGFIFCEFLNMIIVIVSMYLTDYFLGGEFRNYGKEVLQLLLEDPTLRHDPMNYVFPKETICDFRTYGPSGSIQALNYLCLLPVNILNEKVFVFLWFWFIILLGMSVIGLLYRFVILSSSTLRSMIICFQLSSTNTKLYKGIDVKMSYWDWFILKKLLDNLNEIRFGILCEFL